LNDIFDIVLDFHDLRQPLVKSLSAGGLTCQGTAGFTLAKNGYCSPGENAESGGSLAVSALEQLRFCDVNRRHHRRALRQALRTVLNGQSF